MKTVSDLWRNLDHDVIEGATEPLKRPLELFQPFSGSGCWQTPNAMGLPDHPKIGLAAHMQISDNSRR